MQKSLFPSVSLAAVSEPAVATGAVVGATTKAAQAVEVALTVAFINSTEVAVLSTAVLISIAVL